MRGFVVLGPKSCRVHTIWKSTRLSLYLHCQGWKVAHQGYFISFPEWRLAHIHSIHIICPLFLMWIIFNDTFLSFSTLFHLRRLKVANSWVTILTSPTSRSKRLSVTFSWAFVIWKGHSRLLKQFCEGQQHLWKKRTSVLNHKYIRTCSLAFV